MNDFREYSAAFHAQNDDMLHYGIKGMKWKHHKLQFGGAIGLTAKLLKRRKKDSDEEEKPSRGTYADAHPRGTYADSERAAAQAKTVEDNRNALKRISAGLQARKQQDQNTKAWKNEVRNNYGKQGSATDQAKQKRTTDLELDKERKKRNRTRSNHKNAERAYRRGGH